MSASLLTVCPEVQAREKAGSGTIFGLSVVQIDTDNDCCAGISLFNRFCCLCSEIGEIPRLKAHDGIEAELVLRLVIAKIVDADCAGNGCYDL